MYCVVALSKHKYIVVSSDWVKGIQPHQLLNYGIITNKKYTVFFSHEKNTVPNFQINLSSWLDFDRNVELKIDSCYLGAIDRVFGEYS